VVATRKARQLPHGPIRDKQRTVARVYHLLAKEAAFASNVQYIGLPCRPESRKAHIPQQLTAAVTATANIANRRSENGN
jgi:hypothetical protein